MPLLFHFLLCDTASTLISTMPLKGTLSGKQIKIQAWSYYHLNYGQFTYLPHIKVNNPSSAWFPATEGAQHHDNIMGSGLSFCCFQEQLTRNRHLLPDTVILNSGQTPG